MLVARIVTGLVLGGVVTAALLLLPTPAAAAVLGLLWLAGAWEWAGLAGLASRGRLVFVLLMLGAMVLVMLMGMTRPVVLLSFAAALLGWIAAFFGVLTYPRSFPSALVLGAGVVALLPAWILIVALHAFAARGPALALLALALVWAADVGAYVVGRSIGRVKLAPRVSPGKTWEGVSGGVLLAVLIGWLGSLWLGLPALAVVGVAVATALVSVVGDLTVSMLKRNRGLKDSGRLLPGHGGVMDRIDGLVAAIPFFVLGLYVAGIAL